MPSPWALTIDERLYSEVREHLFPGDGDEHGGVIAAGISSSARGTRLLARDFFPAVDGIDFVPGRWGYRMLRAQFVSDRIRACRDDGLVYLAVHNHWGHDRVAFSEADNRSHERGYPALLDISDQPVGALVFAERAAAGDIWTPDRVRRPISEVVVVGQNVVRLHLEPPPPPPTSDVTFDRQVRWFGEQGQALLGRLKVGIIGAGGVGLPLVNMMARIGVGSLLVIDPDRVDPTNLPRLDARRLDAMMPLRRFEFLEPVADRWSTRKTVLARRIAKRANPKIHFAGISENVIEPKAAFQLRDCDFIFLAADSHQAKMVFNAVVHQYLIPGIQMGTRIVSNPASGKVGDIDTNVRLVLPTSGCLRCAHLISPAKLQDESLGSVERERNRYVDEVHAPSVITFNALAAAQAANDFMLMMGGMIEPTAPMDRLRFRPRERKMEAIRGFLRDENCADCGDVSHSRRARGDFAELPLPER